MHCASDAHSYTMWLKIGWIGTALLASTTESLAEISLYVSPRGQANWSGALYEPNIGRSDGPLPSLYAARDLIRAHREKGEWRNEAITVLLRGGTYYLSETLVFEPCDSGTKDKPITYAAYPNETPVISGGRALTGWQSGEFNGQPCWKLEIPEVKQGGWYFRQLFVNGQRRTRTRVPKEGVFFFTGARESDSPGKEKDIYDEATFRPGDLRNWSNLGDIDVITLQQCDSSHSIMRAVDERNHIVKFAKRTYLKPGGRKRTEEYSRYYVENVREAFETPGQWYLDRPTGTLYYLPLPGEEPDKTTAIAPRVDILLKVAGDAQKHAPVHDLIIRGLSFRHTNWHMPPDTHYCQAGQAMHRTPPCGAVQLQEAVDCRIIDCVIAQVAAYGIELTAGCKNNEIVGCTLTDLGAGGIKVGQDSSHTTITNNEVSDGGRIYPDTIGIWIGRTGDNVVSHNHIHHLYYTGICVGWNCGYMPTPAVRNLVEYNHIHHIGQGLLSDMGGIYTLGVSPGTVIRNNLIHDVESYDFGGYGLYNDEGSSHILLENNIVYRTSDAGYHLNYGRENIIRNNIFAYGRTETVDRTAQEDHLSFTFERNIVYTNLSRVFDGEWRWDKGNFRMDHNLYWRAGGQPFDFPGDRNLEQWRQRQGQDQNSLVADPLFVDPQDGDFTLKPGSPAEKIGFVPIDTSRIGRLK